MKQFNVFQALFMSFYSRRLYRDVATNWGGRTFGYLLLLLALAWVMSTFQIQQGVSQGYSQFSDTTVSQIPVLTINNGMLSTPENRPYIITAPDSKTNLVVIDTSGQYTSLEQVNTVFLVTKNTVQTKQKDGVTRIDQFPASSANFVIVPQVINSYFKQSVGFLWIPIFIFALLGSFLYRIIQSLVYGIFGKIFSVLMGVKLSYWQCVQVMMVAITPVIIVCTVFSVLNIDVLHHHLFYFTLAMAYLAFGIYANKEKV